MNFIIVLTLSLSTGMLLGCAGGNDPGYIFQIIFIVVPLFILGHYLYKKVESASDSLYVIEGQLKRISDKLQTLEEIINSKKETKKTTKK